MSGEVVFSVTGDDLALLDDESFDLVWSALGIVVRARHPWRDGIAATYLDPDGTVTVEANDGRTLAIPPASEDQQPDVPVRAEQVAPPTADPIIAARSVVSPCPDCGAPPKPAGMAGHRRSAHPEPAPPSVPNEPPTRTDFHARSKAAASRTWQENHAA